MYVNIEKTKVVVFKNGGQLARNERWVYDHNALQTVNGLIMLAFASQTDCHFLKWLKVWL